MGYVFSAYLDREGEPAFNPEVFEKLEDTSRPVRKLETTIEDMDRAYLKRERRDYCSHYYMDLMKCRRDYFPMTWHCYEELHKYQHCTIDEWKLRMKEYERTKRLLDRERKRVAAEKREMIAE